MKTNTMMRVASVLLVAVLLSTCAIAGTYAKYVSTTTGTDSARVATWDFKVNGTKANSNTFTFDLFKTILDTDGSSEGDINPADGTIIAPGTKGSFDIILKNDSEVTAKYAIDYTVTNTNDIPVEFSVDGEHWDADLADVTAGDATKLAAKTGTTTITVQWRWAFERGDTDDAKNTNNTADTTLGLAGEAVLSVQAVITVEQVD